MQDMETLIKKAGILVEALPYIQKLFGKIVVVKYGGNAMLSEELKHSVMEDVTLLKYIGMKPVIVHGGGPDIAAALSAFGVESKFVGGLRVTDKTTMDIAQMVLVGKTNKEIVAQISQNGGHGIGLSGIDNEMILCQKLRPKIDGKTQDIGFVGDIVHVDAETILKFTEGDYIPVIAPIGVDGTGQSYNINADTVAAAVATALQAEKLMLLTNVEGVKDAAGQIIYEISEHQVDELIQDGTISGGMIPKVQSCVEAIHKGVNRVHIIDGRIPHCLLLEIFTDTGVGTMIKK